MVLQYTTKNQLRTWSAELSVNQRRNLRETARLRSIRNATFLSHSSKDNELVVGVIRILTNNGANVYVDEKDPEMPPYTNTETAQKLKERIDQCGKFVVLATENSKQSKWVPWELGIADGKKEAYPLALFPQ